MRLARAFLVNPCVTAGSNLHQANLDVCAAIVATNDVCTPPSQYRITYRMLLGGSFLEWQYETTLVNQGVVQSEIRWENGDEWCYAEKITAYTCINWNRPNNYSVLTATAVAVGYNQHRRLYHLNSINLNKMSNGDVDWQEICDVDGAKTSWQFEIFFNKSCYQNPKNFS